MTVPSVSPRVLAAAILLAAVATAGVLVPVWTIVDIAESMAADPVRFALIVVGLYLLRPLVAMPTTPLAAVVGYGYGIWPGAPVALVGVVVTALPVFLVARWLGATAGGTPPVAARGRLGQLLERTERAVDRYYETAGPIRGVTASRLAPIPSDVSTCAAAISGVRLRHLVVGTALGELPWTAAAVVVGASAATVTTGSGELGSALTIACLIAAALLLAGPAYRTLRTRSRADSASGPTDG